MHAVLQHLADPATALHEAHRVLRPGGVIGVADADFGGFLIAPRTPELDAAIELQERLRLRSGGDTRIGGRLSALLLAAGFERVEGSATANATGTPEIARLTGQFNAAYMSAPEVVEHVTATGWATRRELAAAAGAWTNWGEAPGAFQAAFWCTAIGWKPG
jgi:SAM-dependent methyltransferase